MHKTPTAVPPPYATTSTTNGSITNTNHIQQQHQNFLALDAINQWDEIKTIFSPPNSSSTTSLSKSSSSSQLSTELSLLSPSLPSNELSHLLFNRYPLTFPNFLRIYPLQEQRQFHDEIKSLPQHLNDLTVFSTKLIHFPALSFAYRSYLKYRHLFNKTQKPMFFHLNGSNTEFISTYNRPEISETQYIRNSKELSDRVRLKVTFPQIQNFINSFQTTTPLWAVLSYIPLDITLQSIIAIFSKQGGYRDCILLPPEPTSLTKIAFIAFDTVMSRDSACIALNGSLSPNINDDTSSSASTATNTNQKNQPQQSQQNQQNQSSKSISPMQYRLRVSPWISTSQFDQDSSHVSITKPLNYRQPTTPIGFRQWITGPIPLSILNHRLDKDINNALLIAKFFDYIRCIPIESNLDHLLEHLNRYLVATVSGTGSGQSTSSHQSSSLSSLSQNSMLKFRFILRYLREVHIFDYFTTTLYPSKELLDIDIGCEWYFIDPPTITSAHMKSYSTNFSTPQFTSFPLPNESKQHKLYEQQHQSSSSSSSSHHHTNNPNQIAELALEQSSFFTPNLRQIPFDQALNPQQLAITAYYNAILSVSPPTKQTTGLITETTEIFSNFWNLQHYYQGLFYPSYSINQQQNPNGIVDSSNGYSLPDTIFTTAASDSNTGGNGSGNDGNNNGVNGSGSNLTTQTTATAGAASATPLIIQPKYQSSDPNFWSNIDSACGQISALFNPTQIDRTITPTIDMMDPDLFYLPQLFSSPTLTTSISSILQRQTSLLSSSSLSSLSSPSSSSLLPQLAAPIPPSSLRLPEKYSILLLAVQLSQFYQQITPDRFKCSLCTKLMISQGAVLKHILTQHGNGGACSSSSIDGGSSTTSGTVNTSNSRTTTATATTGGGTKGKNTSSSGGSINDVVSMSRIRLLQNTIYMRYLYDECAAALNPPVLSLPQENFILKNLNPTFSSSSNEKNTEKNKKQLKIFTPQYRVYEILTYKRHSLATIAIDHAWRSVLQQLQSHLMTTRLQKQQQQQQESGDQKDTQKQKFDTTTVKNSLLPTKMKDNDDRSQQQLQQQQQSQNNQNQQNNQNGHPQRNLKLEEKAELHRQKLGTAQLFKGFDGDAYGTGKILKKNQINYLTNIDMNDRLGSHNSNGNDSNINDSSHIFYKKIQSLIDNDPTLTISTDGEIKPHQTQQIRVCLKDIPTYDFYTPLNYGLEPFIGQ